MSLNAGNELDDELVQGVDEDAGQPSTDLNDVLFNDVIPGQVPELDEDIEILSHVVTKFKNLTYLNTDIVGAQGMSKTFAMEAERIMPGFLNEDVPIGYFTEEPTGTRLKLTLEAIAAEQKSLLSQIIEAIVKLVKKALDWLRETYNKIFDAKREADVASVYTAKAENVKDTLNKVQKAYLSPDKAVSDLKGLLREGDEQKVRDYITALEKQLMAGDDRIGRLYKSINSGNEMYHIAVKDPIVEHILQLATKADQMVASLNSFDKVLLKEILDLSGNNEEALIRAAAVKKSLTGLPRVFQLDKSFDAFAQSMAMTFNTRTGVIMPDKFPLVKVFETYQQLFSKYNTKALREHIGSARQKLEELQKTLLEMQRQAGATTKERDAVNPILNEVFRMLFAEMRGLLRIIIQGSQIVSAWSWMAETMNKISESYEFKIRDHLSGLDAEELKKVEEYFGLKPRGVVDGTGKT